MRSSLGTRISGSKLRTERTLVIGMLCLGMVWLAAQPCGAATQEAINRVSEGNALYVQRDFDGAIAKYDDALTEEPTYAFAFNNRGLCFFHQGDYTLAIADFDAAKSSDPAYLAPYVNKGKCFAAQELNAEAVTELEAGLAIDANHANLLYNLGWVYDEMGQYADAVAQYDLVLTADPDDAQAKAGRAVSLARLGQETEAVAGFYGTINTAGISLEDRQFCGYNLAVLRGFDLSLASEAAAVDFQQGLFDISATLFDSAIIALQNAQGGDPSVPHIPWMLSWAYILVGEDAALADAAIADAHALMTSIPFSGFGDRAVDVFVNGVPLGTTPMSLHLFQSQFDVVARYDDGTSLREAYGPVYADGTVGGASDFVVLGAPVASYTDFGVIADTDVDWLDDAWEQLYFLSLSGLPHADPDSDSLTNLEEQWLGTDPDDADSDDDGLTDGDECYDDGTHGDTDGYTTDPGDADSDDDGLSDGDEHAQGTDPNNGDTDGDDMLDGWEVNNGLNPLDSGDIDLDLDGDGLPNYGEWTIGSDAQDGASPVVAYVDGATGDDTTGDGSAALPFATIGQALTVNAAVSPLLVSVAAGEYAENVTLHAGVALVGAGGFGAARTTITASGSGRPVTASGASALMDLRLTGGAMNGPGGGLAGQDQLYLSGVDVTGNATTGSGAGGGVYFSGGNLRLVNCVFAENQAYNLDSAKFSRREPACQLLLLSSNLRIESSSARSIHRSVSLRNLA